MPGRLGMYGRDPVASLSFLPRSVDRTVTNRPRRGGSMDGMAWRDMDHLSSAIDNNAVPPPPDKLTTRTTPLVGSHDVF